VRGKRLGLVHHSLGLFLLVGLLFMLVRRFYMGNLVAGYVEQLRLASYGGSPLRGALMVED
jgi:hypothetical protein